MEVKRGLKVLWGIVIELGVGLAYLGFDAEATGEVVSFCVTERGDEIGKSCEVGRVISKLQVLITSLKRVWWRKAVDCLLSDP